MENKPKVIKYLGQTFTADLIDEVDGSVTAFLVINGVRSTSDPKYFSSRENAVQEINLFLDVLRQEFETDMQLN